MPWEYRQHNSQRQSVPIWPSNLTEIVIWLCLKSGSQIRSLRGNIWEHDDKPWDGIGFFRPVFGVGEKIYHGDPFLRTFLLKKYQNVIQSL